MSHEWVVTTGWGIAETTVYYVDRWTWAYDYEMALKFDSYWSARWCAGLFRSVSRGPVRKITLI